MILTRIFLILQILFSYIFSKTAGLIYYDDKVHYCNDLMSSGSEDSMVVELAMYVYWIPLLLTMASNRKLVLYALVGAYILQLGSYLLIQVCSITDTIIYGLNIPLILIQIIPLTAIYLLTEKIKNTPNNSSCCTTL